MGVLFVVLGGDISSCNYWWCADFVYLPFGYRQENGVCIDGDCIEKGCSIVINRVVVMILADM